MFLPQKAKPGGGEGRSQGDSGNVGYVYDLDCGDGTMSICVCPNLSNGIH